MLDALVRLAHSWSALYQNSAAIRTSVGFAHIGGLVVGGGCAIAEDRAILAAVHRTLKGRRDEVRRERPAHAVILAGLAVVVVSGLLLFAADRETYLYSTPFWIKMGFVVALLGNGAVLARAERQFDRDPAMWRRVRRTSILSLGLWLMTTLLGATLPNV
jgi:uncharacterized membrane protein